MHSRYGRREGHLGHGYQQSETVDAHQTRPGFSWIPLVSVLRAGFRTGTEEGSEAGEQADKKWNHGPNL